MAKIWMNHWFSTAYFIAELIKDNNPGYRIAGTNERLSSPMKNVCDEWCQEPVLPSDEYVEYCLDFCERHQIDVFMPRRHMLEISKNKQRFEEYGVRVMVDDYSMVNVLSHKDQAYSLLSEQDCVVTPPHHVVSNVCGFKEAYRSLKERFSQVCFKFVKDEGGKSYRLIDNSRKGYEALFKKQTSRMTFDAACEALSERQTFPPLMVMPYLPGDEMSVDCLKTQRGVIAIPRRKGSTRIEHVEYDEEILEMCHSLLEVVPLEQPCNIQFKYLEDTPYFLEINTRMSGGTHMSCLASGVNIPSIAVNKLLGIDEPWRLIRDSCEVTQIETPFLI